MATPYLCLNNRTGTPTVKRVVGGAPVDQGVALPSATTETDDWNLLPGSQRAIRFGGYQTWIVVQKSRIYRTTDAGATYSTVFGPDTDLGDAGKTGPYLFYINGTATLVVIAINSSGAMRQFTSTDGITWTKSGTLSSPGGAVNYPFVSTVQWRGSLYFIRRNTSTASTPSYALNPGAGTLTEIAQTVGGGQYNYDMCAVNDKLFQLAYDSGGPSWKLFELSGGAWVLRVTIVTVGGITNTGAPALFYDNASGRLVALMMSGTGPSYRAFSIDPSTFGTTDLGATITGAFGTADDAAIFRVIYDGSVTVGGTPVPFICYKSTGGAGAMTEFQWNGVASAPTSVGSGVDAAFCVPFGDQATAGGSVFWTSGQRHVERLTATPVAGGVRYGFKLYSPNASVDTVSVAWIRGLAASEFPATPFASLQNPSAGTISGGNQIDGLDAADNGATTFLVTWDASGDGYPNNAFAKTCPTVFS
jgi:hypothetical protein